MILVDTSVLVDYFKGVTTDATSVLGNLVAEEADLAISPYTYQELLQGARTEPEFARLKRVLSTQVFLWLPMDTKTFEKAARLYFDLRRSGVTVRSTIDVLIALTAIEHRVRLLNSDRDFDQMAEHLTDLLIYPV